MQNLWERRRGTSRHKNRACGHITRVRIQGISVHMGKAANNSSMKTKRLRCDGTKAGATLRSCASHFGSPAIPYARLCSGALPDIVSIGLMRKDLWTPGKNYHLPREICVLILPHVPKLLPHSWVVYKQAPLFVFSNSTNSTALISTIDFVKWYFSIDVQY